jgi:hypothetical protein
MSDNMVVTVFPATSTFGFTASEVQEYFTYDLGLEYDRSGLAETRFQPPPAPYQHPRIFMNPEDVPDLRARLTTSTVFGPYIMARIRTGLTSSITGVNSTWGHEDPEEAMGLVLEGLPPGRLQDGVLTSLIQQWVKREPERITRWVCELPEDRFSVGAMETIMNIWTGNDPILSGVFMHSMSPGVMKDAAASAYSNRIAREYPETALVWARSIADHAGRAQAVDHAKSFQRGRE